MSRREFIMLLGGAAAAWPMGARGQQPDRRRRLGILMAYSETDPEAQSFVRTFVTGLRELGWTDGGNLHIDYRWAIGDIERMSALAQELVALQPDAILANTTPVTAALRRATRTIPIAFAIVSDPVGAGFVESLARPGGNITGFINVEAAMGGKWLELLKEMVPGIQRAAILFNPTTAPGGGAYFLPAFEAAAQSLAISPIVAPVRDGTEIEDAISAIGREPNGGVVTMTDGSTLTHRARIISGANRYKLPHIGPSRLFARDGALLSYGHDTLDIFRRAAPYVDRILRGANPSQLPVQVPTKFELCINLKTAKAIGLEVPAMLLARADEVIE